MPSTRFQRCPKCRQNLNRIHFRSKKGDYTTSCQTCLRNNRIHSRFFPSNRRLYYKELKLRAEKCFECGSPEISQFVYFKRNNERNSFSQLSVNEMKSFAKYGRFVCYSCKVKIFMEATKDCKISKKIQSLRQFVNTVKEVFIGKCLDCEKVVKSDNVMEFEFDHVPGRGTKITEISTMVGSGFDIDIITEEMKKCDLVCHDCHSKRTAERILERFVKEDLPFLDEYLNPPSKKQRPPLVVDYPKKIQQLKKLQKLALPENCVFYQIREKKRKEKNYTISNPEEPKAVKKKKKRHYLRLPWKIFRQKKRKLKMLRKLYE